MRHLQHGSPRQELTASAVTTLTLACPDDWHVHLRDGAEMAAVLPYTAARFARAIVMPNLTTPVTSVSLAVAYRSRIVQHLSPDSEFEPLMTLYLTDHTSADDVLAARESGLIHAIKLYPAGATTHSAAGVTNLKHCVAALEAMQEVGMPLLVHAEVTDSAIDIFDRERIFLERQLSRLVSDFPALKVVVEHITTQEAVDWVLAASNHVAATITPHHLLMNRNQLFAGGLRPHHYCLPVLKREEHRLALLSAATSGNPKFFLGTDSAPHPQHHKERACGCAGIFNAHIAIELYAEAFEQTLALDKLEPFASHFGADFYGLPRNTRQVTLHRRKWPVPETLPFSGSVLVPMRAGQFCIWQLA